MEFIHTKRGGRKLLLDGYAYTVDKKKDAKTYWRCERRGTCGGRLRTEDDVIISDPANHSHPPDGARNMSLKTVHDIKERARETDEFTTTIIHTCKQHLPLSAASAIVTDESLARMVRRQRVAPDGEILTEELKRTTRGENFLIYDSEDLVILATQRNLRILHSREHWLGDGTFDAAPLGHQLYTIHGLFEEGHTIPLVYCIARRKDQMTYEFIFRKLKEQINDLSPVSFTTDYERAAQNAIAQCFPQTTIYGCLFHFGQCLWRKIQALGLQTWYSNPDNAGIIKCIHALALVPVQDVADCFNAVVEEMDEQTDHLLSEFLGYFEATWIGVIQRGRRRRPAFEIQKWNVFDRVLQGLPRTTNSLEGWHRGFEQRMAITHPTRCRLVAKLKTEQSSWEMKIEQLSAGMEMPRIRKTYRLINERLESLVECYHTYAHKIEYLRAVSHRL